MKKIITVIMLFALLLNIGGELILHQYAIFLSDRFFDAQTSKGLYNVDDLTEVKVPVNIPMITDWNDYENISGQVKFENASYNYVKMRITRDAIYLMCVPNYATTQLCKDNIINAKNIKDIPVPKKEHVPFIKMKVSDNVKFSFVRFSFNSVVKGLKTYNIQPAQGLASQSLDIPGQPPNFSC